jgi:HK97 family phage major capsid protein
MSKIVSYQALKRARKADLTELVSEFSSLYKQREIKSGKTLFNFIDVAGNNPQWLREFSTAFSLSAYGYVRPEVVSRFRSYNESEKETMKNDLKSYSNSLSDTSLKTFDIGVDDVLETTTFPLLEGLMRETGVLSRVQIQTETDYKRMVEMDEEKDAEILSKTATGTKIDDVIRKGDILIADKKIQASTSIQERDLMALDATEMGIFIARLMRRLEYRMVDQIMVGTDSAQFRGIINTAGTDSTNLIGSLPVTLSALGLTGDVEALEYLDQQLPKNLGDAQDGLYVYLMNRRTRLRVSRARDAQDRRIFNYNDNLKINNKEIITVPNLADNRVLLVPLSMYQVIVAGGLNLVDDGGSVQFLEGYINYRATVYADGTPRGAFKRKIGATTDNNQEYNMWRHADLLASY